MKKQLKNTTSRIEECKEKMNQELEDGIGIEADIFRKLNQFEKKSVMATKFKVNKKVSQMHKDD